MLSTIAGVFFAATWTAWDHVRTLTAIAAGGLLAMAFSVGRG
jgi:uncharacterized membrane protein